MLLENVYTQLNRKTALDNFYSDMMEKYPDNVQWINKAGAYVYYVKNMKKLSSSIKKH